MPNTGRKIVLTLKEIFISSGNPTGNTKPNVIGDPDYIAPSTDAVACPVVYNLTCPVVIGSGLGAGEIIWEFSLRNSVSQNPAVAKIKLKFFKAGVLQDTTIILNNVANKSYWTGTKTGLSAGTYSIDIEYLDNADVVQATCVDTAINIIVT